MTYTYDYQIRSCHRCGLPVKRNWYTRHIKSNCTEGIHMTKAAMAKRIRVLKDELERLQETIYSQRPEATAI